jgi:hypothetical protein
MTLPRWVRVTTIQHNPSYPKPILSTTNQGGPAMFKRYAWIRVTAYMLTWVAIIGAVAVSDGFIMAWLQPDLIVDLLISWVVGVVAGNAATSWLMRRYETRYF